MLVNLLSVYLMKLSTHNKINTSRCNVFSTSVYLQVYFSLSECLQFGTKLSQSILHLKNALAISRSCLFCRNDVFIRPSALKRF